MAKQLIRFDPFSNVAPLRILFKDWKSGCAIGGGREAPHAWNGETCSKLDVTENEAACIVNAETPGVKKDAIRDSVEGGRRSPLRSNSGATASSRKTGR